MVRAEFGQAIQSAVAQEQRNASTREKVREEGLGQLQAAVARLEAEAARWKEAARVCV